MINMKIILIITVIGIMIIIITITITGIITIIIIIITFIIINIIIIISICHEYNHMSNCNYNNYNKHSGIQFTLNDRMLNEIDI